MHLDEPTPIRIEVIVSPVEVRIAIGIDIREVGIAVRIDPRGIRIQHCPHHRPLNRTRTCSWDCIVFGILANICRRIPYCQIPSNIHSLSVPPTLAIGVPQATLQNGAASISTARDRSDGLLLIYFL